MKIQIICENGICCYMVFYGFKNMNDFTFNNIVLSPRALMAGENWTRYENVLPGIKLLTRSRVRQLKTAFHI